MFDIGWQEVMVVAVLAIIVIGPKDLPRAIKTITHWVRKARSLARDLQDGLDEVVREAELDDIKKEANKIMEGTGVDPSKGLTEELDMSEFEKDWREAVDDMKAKTDPNAKPVSETPKALPQTDTAALDDDPELAPKAEPAGTEASKADADPADKAKG